MTKIRTRTYIKLCKGRRVLTQYVQKIEEKTQTVSKACYSQTRPITLHTEKLFCVFG